jgi:hypothetical protein
MVKVIFSEGQVQSGQLEGFIKGIDLFKYES